MSRMVTLLDFEMKLSHLEVAFRRLSIEYGNLVIIMYDYGRILLNKI